MSLTVKEKVALKAIVHFALENMGGKKPADLFVDNYSFFDQSDLAERTTYTAHEIAGLISSLEGKDVIVHEENDWALTDTGIKEAVKIWES